MIKISNAALAAALLVGTAGISLAPPAFAQKKDEAPKLKLSDDVRKAAVAAQTAIAAKDYATAGTSVAAAETAAKTDDDRYVAESLKLQVTANQIQGGANSNASNAAADQALIAPLDSLIANPSTPPAQLGQYNYMRGSIAFNAKKYADAATYYTKAQAAGYQNADLQLQMAKAKVESGDIAGGIAALDQEVKRQQAAGTKPPENLYRYAIAKLYKTQMTAQTLSWVEQWLQAYPSSDNWRSAIIVFGFQGPTASRLGKPEKVDLYRLMRATKSLADQGDYLEYGQYAKDLGLPNETKAVIDEGRAAGKITASNASANALYKEAQASIRAEGSLAPLATKAAAAAKGDLASQTGDAYLGSGDYAKAIELYRTALQKGVANTDGVNTHLGIALALSGDKAGAKTAFSAVTSAPGTDIASLWNTWIDASAGATAPAPATAAPAAAATPS